jgi:membrane protease YdiL (CAAX protease family)
MIPIPLARPRNACYSAVVDRRSVLAALLITAVFAGVRWRIYATHPVSIPCSADPACAAQARRGPAPQEALAEPTIDGEAWTRRDQLMDLPRLAAFAACLAAMAAFGGLSRWKWRGLSESAVILAAAAIGYMLKQGWFGPPRLANPHVLKALWANVFVVLWEESCYRGLLYLGLRGSLKPAPAALLAGAVFTVMHVQAQPLYAWPGIFCFGVVACEALENGTGLLWLMLVHWLVDSVPFVFAGPNWWGEAWGLGHLLIYATAACALIRLSGRATRTAEE